MKGFRQSTHGRDIGIIGGAHLIFTRPAALVDVIVAGVDNAGAAATAGCIIGNHLIGNTAIRSSHICNGAGHNDAIAYFHLVDYTGLGEKLDFTGHWGLSPFSLYEYESYF